MTEDTDGRDGQQEENHVGKNGMPDGTIFAPFEIESLPDVSDSASQPNDVAEKEKRKPPSAQKHQKPKIISLRQLFRFADKVDFILMFLGTICACAHGVGMPAIFLFFGSLVDTFVDGAKLVTFEGEINWTEERRRYFLDEMIRPKCIYFAVVGFCVLFVAYGQVMFWLTTSHRQTRRIRLQYLQAVLRQEIGWFDTNSVGEIGIRLTDDVNKIQAGIGDKIGGFIQYMTNFVVGLIVALVKGWKLALVILSTSPLLAACAALMMLLITASTKKESEAYAKAGAIAEEDLSAIRTVVAFGGEEKECKRYNANLKDAKSYGIKKSMINGGGMGLTYIVIFCTYALAFWYGGNLTIPPSINGTTASPQINLTAAKGMANTQSLAAEYSIGTMLVVFFCAVYGAMSLGNASPNIEFIATARGSAYSIWTIIDKKSEIDSMSDSGAKPETLTGNIEIKGATFYYPSRPDIQVLNGLNVNIERGQTVALVGSSGCGKSTVIQLIQRFYDPLEGAVMIDGTDIRQLNIKWLRQQIGVVSQEPVLFATTIAENIRYGKDGVSQEEIEKAAKEANAHDFISKLPLKYETLVGERGAQLSGGEKQRIAIARALVRDPKILLLDEATSALDTESEAIVQAALDKASQGRTTVVVAHRLSTIRTADIIYGLRDGAVHESGTHNELMERKGIYYELVTNQHVMEDKEEDDEEEDEGYSADEDVLRGVDGSLPKSILQRSKSVVSDRVPIKEIQTAATENDNPCDASMSRIMKLNASEWPFILLGCFFAIVHGGAQPLFGLVFGGFIGIYKETDSDKMMSDIIFYALMFIVIGVPTGIAMFFQFWMFGISGETLTMRIRKMTFRCLLQQDIAYFDDPTNSVGAMATRLATDASAVQGATGVRVGVMLQALSCIGVGLAIGFIYSWKYTLFILGIVPLLLMAAAIQMKLAKGFSGKNNKELERAGKVANEALSNIRMVASLTKEHQFIDEYDRLNAPIYRQNLKAAHLFGIVFAILQSMIYFAFSAIFYFGAWLIANDGLEYDSMFKVFISIIFGTVSFGSESQFAPDYGKARMAAARILALYDRKPSASSGTAKVRRSAIRSRAVADCCCCKDGLIPGNCSGSIEFKDVHFSYPTRPTIAVLRGLSLKVEQGHTIALVGTSGCGKSTTVQLLERFYDVPNGEVMIDGHNVKSVNVPWLRSQLGLVSQEPTLFRYSIRENIAYGDNSRQVSMDEIIEAARQANIHNFIQSLPQGYETNVGDRGTQLSGGQKQRIAIARALVRNPKILLLDEATSALDTESEKIVQEALDRAQEGRTCLVIAHRLSTIQNATQIVVFQNGCITEEGTHSELMAQKGFYYKLVLAQGHRR